MKQETINVYILYIVVLRGIFSSPLVNLSTIYDLFYSLSLCMNYEMNNGKKTVDRKHSDCTLLLL